MALDTMFMLEAQYEEMTTKYRQVTVKATYGRILDTIEVFGRSRITQHEIDQGRQVDVKALSLPDVYRLIGEHKNDIFTPMTEAFQRWVYRFNVDRMFGRKLSPAEHEEFYQKELKQYKTKTAPTTNTIRNFGRLFRSNASHTNYAGTDKCANYIAQENLEADNPKFFNIVTGRWVGKLQGDKMQVINASKGFLHLHPFDDPGYFDEPLSTGRVLRGNVIVRDDLRIKYGDFGDCVCLPVILPLDDLAEVQGVVVPTSDEPLRKFG